MNAVIAVLPLILALSRAASVVPVDTSSVNVKHSGQDYSYTIQENRGVVIDPSHVPPQQQVPVARSSQYPLAGSILLNQIDEKFIQHDVKPIVHGQVQPIVHGQVQPIVHGQVQDQVHIQARLRGEEKALNVLIPTVDLIPNVQFDYIRYPYGPYYPFYPNLVRVV